eukprot:TRINITY_DN5294_c0_g3_i1.p1 TRINITY_DN5294_c0_g3~~TRINITY_DN5294_c0_g3_i1.p1  ORF type:complete len:296 (-),score=44.48 TRINITY_DN5294_c0_g3_i1:58-945(-)
MLVQRAAASWTRDDSVSQRDGEVGDPCVFTETCLKLEEVPADNRDQVSQQPNCAEQSPPTCAGVVQMQYGQLVCKMEEKCIFYSETVGFGGYIAMSTFPYYTTPSSQPTSLPTPSPQNSMSGDPHVWYNGTRTTIHLPTDGFTNLFEQDGVTIRGLGGPERSMKMNYIYAVSVLVGGRELARLEQKRGHCDVTQHLMDLTFEGEKAPVKRGQRRAASLLLTMTRDSVKFADEVNGLAFTVASRKTLRADAPDSHHLNLHFDKGVVTSGARSATGVLPQVWGAQEMSPAVRDLLRT